MGKVDNMERRGSAFVAIVLTQMLFVTFSGCLERSDNIDDILKEPSVYEGKAVALKGTVTDTLAIPFVRQGAYELSDGTGSIWVVTSSGVPKEGDKTSLEGRVRISFKLGTEDFGTVVIESSRKTSLF